MTGFICQNENGGPGLVGRQRTIRRFLLIRRRREESCGSEVLRLLASVACLLLAAYSAALVGIEWRTSQDHVRQYFTDIEGDVLFYAVNTTLSVFLLAGAALLMAFAALGGGGNRVGGSRRFLLTQAAMFGLLAFDDRFQLHERIGYRLGVGDHYVMLAWAVGELALLGLFCRPRHVTRGMAALFVAGGGWFAVMMAFDALMPHDMVLRLSIEDLAKAWGSAMFFGFGWEAARYHLSRDASDGEAAPSSWRALAAGEVRPKLSSS